MGMSYRDCEARGVFFVVNKLECRFRAPARFEDVLTVTTTLARCTRARVDHTYILKRDGIILAEAAISLACVDKSGRVRAIPEWFPAAPPSSARTRRRTGDPSAKSLDANG